VNVAGKFCEETYAFWLNAKKMMTQQAAGIK